MSPFAHHADIAGVAPLSEMVVGPRQTSQQVVGTVVTIRAVPGLTAEWLQRVVDCHLARSAVLGHNMPEMPYCPLVPRGVAAQVRSAGAGFAVEIRAEDPATRQEVQRRAEQLVTRPTGSSPPTPKR